MKQPVRIQLKRTKGWRMPPNTVKVDRTTKWGNPFKVSLPCEIKAARYWGFFLPRNAEQSVTAYRHWIERNMEGRVISAAARRELRGKNLACWCKPGEPCHADVLLEIANA